MKREEEVWEEKKREREKEELRVGGMEIEGGEDSQTNHRYINKINIRV